MASLKKTGKSLWLGLNDFALRKEKYIKKNKALGRVSLLNIIYDIYDGDRMSYLWKPLEFDTKF